MQENILKIFKHITENGITDISVKNSYGKGKVEVMLWYIPFCFDTGVPRADYNYEKEIALANDLYRKAGHQALETEEIECIKQGLGFPAITFDFQVKKQLELVTETSVTFAIFTDIDENLYFTYCDKPFTQNYLDSFENMKPFALEIATEKELSYYEKMLTLSEVVCNELKIPTEQNKGVFTESVFDPKQALDELIRLLNYDNFLSEDEIQEIKHDYNLIFTDREAFAKTLIDKGEWFDEDLEYLDNYQDQDLCYWLFSRVMNVYRDDWKFDTKELSNFISENIGKKFKITFKECENDSNIVCEKLERETDFTLIDLVSGNDDCNFMVVPKASKDRIFYLAEMLKIDIN